MTQPSSVDLEPRDEWAIGGVSLKFALSVRLSPPCLQRPHPLQADVSKFCKPGEGVDGKIKKLDYNIRPSLVIDDATLDVAMSRNFFR